MEDVALLSIGVHDQGDSGAAVRIVLDLGDLARNPELVPLEVDLAVLLLMAAAAVPRGQVTLVVAAAGPLLRLQQRLLRGSPCYLIEPGHRAEPGARCHRSELFDAHLNPRTRRSSRHP